MPERKKDPKPERREPTGNSIGAKQTLLLLIDANLQVGQAHSQKRKRLPEKEDHEDCSRMPPDSAKKMHTLRQQMKSLKRLRRKCVRPGEQISGKACTTCAGAIIVSTRLNTRLPVTSSVCHFLRGEYQFALI